MAILGKKEFNKIQINTSGAAILWNMVGPVVRCCFTWLSADACHVASSCTAIGG